MDLESLCKILNFVMGMLVMYLLQLAWGRYRSRYHPDENSGHKVGFNRGAAVLVGVAVIVFGAVFTGIQSWQTDEAVRDLTRQTQECYRQFAVAIHANNDVRAQNDQLSREQRNRFAINDEAMQSWLNQLLNPPPEIAALLPTDQRRKDFNVAISQEFNRIMAESKKIVADSQEQEKINDTERKPFPEPTCGMEPEK